MTQVHNRPWTHAHVPWRPSTTAETQILFQVAGVEGFSETATRPKKIAFYRNPPQNNFLFLFIPNTFSVLEVSLPQCPCFSWLLCLPGNVPHVPGLFKLHFPQRPSWTANIRVPGFWSTLSIIPASWLSITKHTAVVRTSRPGSKVRRRLPFCRWKPFLKRSPLPLPSPHLAAISHAHTNTVWLVVCWLTSLPLESTHQVFSTLWKEPDEWISSFAQGLLLWYF